MIHDTKPAVETDVTAGHIGIVDIADITRTAPPYHRNVTFVTHGDDSTIGYRGARKRPRPTRPMFWESRRRWRAELDDRPDPPECLRGVLTDDYRPTPPREFDRASHRQRERATIRSPFGPRGGETR